MSDSELLEATAASQDDTAAAAEAALRQREADRVTRCSAGRLALPRSGASSRLHIIKHETAAAAAASATNERRIISFDADGDEAVKPTSVRSSTTCSRNALLCAMQCWSCNDHHVASIFHRPFHRKSQFSCTFFFFRLLKQLTKRNRIRRKVI